MSFVQVFIVGILLVIIEKFEIVDTHHRTFASGEVVAIFACGGNYQQIFGTTVGGVIFQFDFEAGVFGNIIAYLHLSVSDDVGSVGIKQMLIFGIGAAFERFG